MKLFQKLILLIILILSLNYTINNWDSLYSGIEHFYYQLLMKDNHDKKSIIETISITSHELNGIKMESKIYLPGDYAINTNQKYPVLYLLHGYPGTDNDWLINTNLQTQLDKQIKQHILPPLIVVFPDARGQLIKDSQYIDGKIVNQKMESYLIKELIPYINTAYRALPGRRSRAIGGISSGAYGAVYLGLKHNDLFSIIISHSGYFINNEGVMDKLVGTNMQLRDQYNPISFISKITLSPQTYIYFDIGNTEDNNYINSNKKFDQILTKLNINHKFTVTNGTHNWSSWSKSIINSLSYLGKQIINK